MLLNYLDGIVTFQTFGDSEKRADLIKVLHGTHADLAKTLKKLNDKGAGIFFTVNRTDGKGRLAENVTGVRALFVDLDTPDVNRQFDYYLPPTIIIESSPGKHHCYWFLRDELPLDEFSVCQKILAEMTGGDPKVHDLPRVMRVPGYLHKKSDPFLVREIHESGERYTAAEMRQWLDSGRDLIGELPDMQPKELTQAVFDAVVAAEDDQDAIDELFDMLDTLASAEEGTRNDTLNKVAFRAYGFWKAGRLTKPYITQQLRTVARSMGLDPGEITATLRSAAKKAVPVLNDLSIDDMPMLDSVDVSHSAASKVDLEKAAAALGISREGAGPVAVALQWARDVPDENPDWLWEGWLCKSVLHILAGVPGAGKTTLALDMAATISRGGKWPDGTTCEPQNVLFFTTEDSLSMTIRPRLRLAGADLSKIAFVQDELANKNKKEKYFDPSRHMPILEHALKQIGNFGLVIIDPVVSAIAGDHNKNEDVRRGLAPLVALAKNTGAAILGITHFGKGKDGKDPNERILGSTAFTGVSRITMCAIQETDENGDRIRTLVRSKANITADTGGYRYAVCSGSLPGIHSTTHIRWGEFVEGTASDIVESADQTAEERGAVGEAKEFLRDFLADGPRQSKSVEQEAAKAGITRNMLRKAKISLKIKVRRGGGLGGAGHWYWSLPNSEDLI